MAKQNTLERKMHMYKIDMRRQAEHGQADDKGMQTRVESNLFL